MLDFGFRITGNEADLIKKVASDSKRSGTPSSRASAPHHSSRSCPDRRPQSTSFLFVLENVAGPGGEFGGSVIDEFIASHSSAARSKRNRRNFSPAQSLCGFEGGVALSITPARTR